MKQKTVRLETLSKLYDIPLGTIRHWASDRKFPGITKRNGGRRIYVDPEMFDQWFRGEDFKYTNQETCQSEKENQS